MKCFFAKYKLVLLNFNKYLQMGEQLLPRPYTDKNKLQGF